MQNNNLGLSDEELKTLNNALSPTAEILRAIHELSDKIDADQLNAKKTEKRRFVISCVLNVVFGIAGIVAAVFAVLAYFVQYVS